MTNAIVNTNMNSLLTMGLGCDNGWDQFVDLSWVTTQEVLFVLIREV